MKLNTNYKNSLEKLHTEVINVSLYILNIQKMLAYNIILRKNLTQC